MTEIMLSSYDILDWFRIQGFDPPEIKTYRQIKKLPKCLFVLYESRPRVGHWCLVFDDDGRYEFFDPYGIMIDDQLAYSFYENMEQKLTKLLINTEDPTFEINDLQFQKKEKGINTCGKWCCIRYWMYKNGFTKKEFDDIFYYEMKNRDEVVSDLYYLV